MGINWNDLWGQAKEAVSDGLEDVVKTGVPALQASLEKWGIDVLNKQHAETTATLNENVQEILNRPNDGDSFGSYLANSLQAPLLKQYGPLILGGCAVLIIVGLAIKK